MIWLFFIALFLVLLIVVYNSIPWAERKVLFCPSKKHLWKPKTEYSDVYIDVKNPTKIYNKRPNKKCDDYINGWHFNNYPGHKIFIYCHGNSGAISDREYIINICKKFELNLFIFDYRGFGSSSGKPSKKNLKKDGEAAYKYLTEYIGVKSKDIIVWGESLGGYVAVWIASKFPCRSLILLSTFSGLDDAVNNYFESGVAKSLAHGYSSLASLRYDLMPNRKYIRKVKCPVAIIHSKEDDIIPYRCAKINYNNVLHKSKVLITIKGGHSSPDITVEDLTNLFMFCDIPLPLHKQNRTEIEDMLEDIKTVAAKNHNFMR